MTEHTEPKLVSLERSPNDRQSLVEAYESLNGELYRYAFRFLGDSGLAQDCVSETFCRVLKAIRDGLGPVDNLRAYLYRVAHNWVTDYYRGQPEKQISLEAELHGQPEANPSLLVGELLERERIRAALLRLPPDQQQVLILRFVEDQPHEEVAAIMGRSVQATRTLQHRALVSIRQLLTLEDSGFSTTQPERQNTTTAPTSSRPTLPSRQAAHGWQTPRPAEGD